MNPYQATAGATPGEVTATRNDLRVLVAEDDHHDQMLFVMAADDAKVDISIEFASDGREVIELLRSSVAAGSLPDLAVLDLWMPKLDGHEVLEIMVAEPEIRPSTVGVFSSSYRQQDIDRSLELGAAWHEVKPSKYQDLVEFIRRASA